MSYEAGLRYASQPASSGLLGGVVAEAIGFFSDYSNLKGTCNASSGCLSGQIGDEFNGGEVHVLGLELLAGTELRALRRLRIPLKASYTFTRSRFQSSFDSDSPTWGDVEAGDELPYVPSHQLALQAGAMGQRWEATVAARYVSAMRDSAGQGDSEPGGLTDATWMLDVAANYAFGRWGTAYLTVDNLLDQSHIMSRRPVGVRPGKPRTLLVGYKNRF